MDELTSLASKHHTKKKDKAKNTQYQQSLQTTFTNTFTAHKQTAKQTHKKKTPISSQTNASSANVKVKSFSNNKSKQNTPVYSKNPHFSARRETTGRVSNSKKRKGKNKSEFLKSKIEGFELQKPCEARSYFPLTQEEKDLQEYRSYLVAEDGQQIQHEIQDFASSRQGGHLPFDSMFVAQVPLRYHKFYDQSQALSSREGMAKRDWQAFEAVKLKNEQLTNYIQELQKIQQKILEQEQAKRKNLQKKFQLEKKQLMRQINELKDEKFRLNQTNATLQQLFNEGKQNLDNMTRRYNEAVSMSQRTIKKEEKSISVDAVQRRITQLEQQIIKARSNMDHLAKEKNQSQLRLKVCQSEKEEIKSKAQQMLELLKVIQGSYDK